MVPGRPDRDVDQVDVHAAGHIVLREQDGEMVVAGRWCVHDSGLWISRWRDTVDVPERPQSRGTVRSVGVVGISAGDAVAVGPGGDAGGAVAAVVAVGVDPFGGEAFGEAGAGVLVPELGFVGVCGAAEERVAPDVGEGGDFGEQTGC